MNCRKRKITIFARFIFIVLQQLYFLLQEMQRSTSYEKKTEDSSKDVWATAKDIQRIINSHEDKAKLKGSESSIDDLQNILALCHNIIDKLQGKSSKDIGKKVGGKANGKESEGYSEKHYVGRTKQLTSIIELLIKQTQAADEKTIITKVKSMKLQIQTYHKFIDFILEYPKVKTFPNQQQAIPSQQQEKIKEINRTYIQLTTKIKELQQFRSKSKGGKDSTGTITTLLIEPISILLKDKAEEKNKQKYISTILSSMHTGNFKLIQSYKYDLDPLLIESLGNLNSQLENISTVSSEIHEKVRGCLEKYTQVKNIKKIKKNGLVNLLELKPKIDDICQFFDRVYNLPLIKQKYGIGEFSHLSEIYKTRLDIYSEILRSNDKLQEEIQTKIIQNERKKLFDFASELCKAMNGKNGKGNKFIAKNILPNNLQVLIDEVKSLKSQAESYDSLIREGIQKDAKIKDLEESINKKKERDFKQYLSSQFSIPSFSNIFLNADVVQQANKQKISWQEKCKELFIENSQLSNNSKKLQSQNEKILISLDQKERELQEIFQRLGDILPSAQRIFTNNFTRDSIIEKIISYNKSLIEKYQQRERNHIKMSENIRVQQTTIEKLNDHNRLLENEREKTSQKLEDFQKLDEQLAQHLSLLANKEQMIQNLLENIKEIRQDKERMELQHKQEVDNLQLSISNYPERIQDLKKENQQLIDQLFSQKQKESRISTQIRQDNVDNTQLINQFNQKIKHLEEQLLSKQKLITKIQDNKHEIINQLNEIKEFNHLIAFSALNFKEETSSIIKQFWPGLSSQLEEIINQQSESYNTLRSKYEALEANNVQIDIQAKKYKESTLQYANKVSQLNRELKRERDNAELLRQEMKFKDMEIETLQMNNQLAQGQSQVAIEKSKEVEAASQLRKINEDLQQTLKQTQDKLQKSQRAIKELQKQLKNKQQEYSTKLREEELKKPKLPQMNLKRGGNQAQLREILRKEITEQFQEQLISLKEHFSQSFTSMLREQGYYQSIKQITPFSMLYIDRLFQGNIFQDKIHYKFRILQHLSTLYSCKVQQTKLIYKMDQRNSTNFHAYIDNTPDMLCVVMTKTGTVIAGYYSGVYQNAVMTAPGLLITVTKNESFVLKPNNRAMVYDPYFIIFGNAEFRVRSGEASVFCNFGINNSYYDHKNKRIGDFLCAENSREVNIEYFEIFQIIYEA